MLMLRALLLLSGLLFGGAGLWAQAADATTPAGQESTRRILASTIAALGGDAWLNLKTIRNEGKNAAYFQGTATGAVAATTDTSKLPNELRVDFSGPGHVVQIYNADRAWEITYKGVRAIPAEKTQEYLRWRDHSLRVALQQWFRDPATVLIDGGEVLVERRPARKVTLIDGHNDAITLELDAATHLPIRLGFEWRDPRFHDKNFDAVEYDNYRPVSGIATPFTITRTHNGQTILQRYISRVQYNVDVPAAFFNPLIEAKRKR